MARLIGALSGALVLSSCGGVSDFTSGSPEPPKDSGVLRLPLLGGTPDPESSNVVAISSFMAGAWLYECTGSLISPRLVLTAGHCVTAWDPQQISAANCEASTAPRSADPKARLVTLDFDARRDLTPDAEGVYRVRSIVAPPANSGWCDRDVALLVLEDAVPGEVAAPLSVRWDEVHDGEAFDAVGFGPNGQREPGTGVRVRARATVACSGIACGSEAEVGSREWLSNDLAACSGDSGGPALDEGGRIIGVLSRGYSDCSSVVYGDVVHFREFICENTVGNEVPGCESARPNASHQCTLSGAPGSAKSTRFAGWLGVVVAGIWGVRRRARSVIAVS